MPSVRTVRVAATQATPIVLEAEAKRGEGGAAARRGGAQGAKLDVTARDVRLGSTPPHAWAKGAAGFGDNGLWQRLWSESWSVPGPLVDRLAEACAARRRALRDRRQRARVGAPRHALQRAPPDRAEGPPVEAPEADADPPRAPLPRDRRRRRPRRRRDARRARQRPELLGEPDAARARALYKGGPRSGSPRPPTTPTAGSRACVTSRSSRGPTSSRCRSTSRARRSRTTSAAAPRPDVFGRGGPVIVEPGGGNPIAGPL